MTIIYNARIVDESADKKGAVIIEGKKIKRVFYGTFKSGESLQDQKRRRRRPQF